ncbi:hypothetical protein SAMN02745945_01461 [Peptoclostridium litorale DSM 5388]|uniref:Uncharacterized protein n=1 Tax=Peptoclostridium litorale DSM 5388 TaxID=1121324 RepID=A0A069RF43_PEPLI|nr:hypothetical protein [Peptoclostridium litorale]KDR95611.1 hypothetical protein CLIT_10c03380 [Peptoclostridium litorale DSM 5388]SIN99383.1 hypothetical protein SAMN02745945_01461 [Peptoclostridium litorale DSM 5388]
MKKEHYKDATANDLVRNLKILNARMRLKIITLIFAAVLIPIAGSFAYSSFFGKKLIVSETQSAMSAARIEKANRVRSYYKGLENIIVDFANRQSLEKFQSGDIDLDVESIRDYNIKNIYIMDELYKNIYVMDEQNRSGGVENEVSETFFEMPVQITGLKVDEEEIFQYMIYKNTHGSSGIYYVVFELSNEYLNSIMESGGDAETTIVNGDFFVVASSRNDEISNAMINPITKELLNGAYGFDEYEGYFWDYGYFEVMGEYFYMQIALPVKSVMGKNIGIQGFFMVMFVAGLFLSGFVIVVIKKIFERYLESEKRISIERESDKLYPYLKSELIEIFESSHELTRSIDNMQRFNESILVLKDRIERQNEGLDEFIRDRRDLKRRIDQDEELKREIAGEFLESEGKRE